MIKCIDIKKQFDGFYALDGVNLHVEPGSVYGLVGPNGAGKSTLIRHLVGIYKQDEGQILIDGEPVYENNKIKSEIAYIPDDLFRFGADNIVDMMNFVKGFYPGFDDERFERLKSVFSIIDLKKPVRRMSKGMQKQAAFWLAICCDPKVLILDEPVDGLDPVMRRQVWSLMMQDVSERGTTVLVSSHNLRELEDVCDTVGIMNKGKVLLERSLSSLQGNVTKLQAAFADDFDINILKNDFEIINTSRLGSIYTLVVRGTQEECREKIAKYSPVLFDALPLTLEEIFIYELGGEDYAVKDIIL
ncbi:MAG: ABC transporter ATP-binding protein [Lachnospiraceae bacterium]|nr:ABC transporter ATP-binding protein [Lachnospiraceae bacterium]